MSLKEVYYNLDKIRGTASTLLKQDLLRDYLQDDTFKKVITLMYDDSLHFKVKALPAMKKQKPSLLDTESTNEELFSFLDTLAEQRGVNNEDKNKLAKLASIDQETQTVVKYIINKDAKGGFSGKTINKAYPNLITLIPYCRCSTAKSKEDTFVYEEGIIEQEKADGMFVNIIFDDKYSLMRTRNGNQVYQLDLIENFLKGANSAFGHTVYMGELLIKANGRILPRKTGNGILNSCLQGTADPSKTPYAVIKLWDAVPYDDFWKGKCNIPYKNRLSRVTKFVKSMNNKDLLSMIDTRMVYSKKESAKFYHEMRSQGKEGTIGKKQNMLWSFTTSVDAIKHKNVSVAEVRIVGWSYGKEGTKYEKCMGSIQCETEDSLVQFSMSGFSDAERLEDWDAKIGKICSVFYESVISSEGRQGIKSLYLPQFDELRPDRSYADTFEDLETR